MPRSPSDHRLRLPHGYHGNREEEEFHGRRRPIRDGRGRWHSQVRPRTSASGLHGSCFSPPEQDHPLDQVQDERERRRRQEEEFQARYRSDPNLARYPVKPCEEAMWMLAQVGRVRHQRRHSDASLAPEHLTPRRTGRKSPAPISTATSPSVTSRSHPPPPPRLPPGSPSGGDGFCGAQVLVCGAGS